MTAQQYSGGTLHQQHLVDRANEFWLRGKEIPIDLMAEMAAEGLDVVALQEKHMEII